MLVLLLTIACILAMSSCRNKKEDDHKHSLTYHEPKESTCKEAGHNGYNGCSCGYKEGYVELPLGKHDYTTVIDEYPSVDKAGKKTLTCSVCGEVKTETIDAYTATLPNISEAIANILEDGTYSLTAKDGSGLTYVKEFSADSNENGTKRFIAFKVVDAQLTSKENTLTGYLKIDIGSCTKILFKNTDPEYVTAPDYFEPIFSAEVYLNGDEVSVSITADGATQTDTYNLTALFLKAFADELDVPYEQLVQSMYLSDKLNQIVPDYDKFIEAIENLNTPKITDEYFEYLEELLSLVGEDLVTTATDKDGNSVYTINVEALNELLDAVDGKTLEEMLTNMYGERPVSNLKSGILALPDTTVMDIADKVIATAEKLGIDKDKVFELIDLLIYEASGTKISVQTELQKNYSKTLLDLILEEALDENATAQERNEFITEFKAQINEIVDMLFSATLDDLYMLYAGALFTAEEEFSFVKELKNVIEGLGEILSIEIVVDENGSLVRAEAIMTDTISLIITNGDDGLVATLVWENNEMRVEADENSFEFYILENDIVTTAAAIEITDSDIGGVITKGISVILSSTEDEELNTVQLNASYSTSQTYNALSFDINGTGFAIEINDKMIEKSFIAKLTEEYETAFLVSADYKETAKGGVEKEIYSLLVQFENYTVIDAELTVEDGILSDASAVLNVYESTYNEDTEEYETTLQDTYDITVACTDKENAKYSVTVNEYVFTVTEDEETVTIEATLDGVQYTIVINAVANEEQLRLDYFIYADEELVFEYTYNETASEDGVTIAYYLKMFDELILDYSYGIRENENGITFTYDITKLMLSMPLKNPGSDWIIDSSEYIEGSGAFTLTFTPAE